MIPGADVIAQVTQAREQHARVLPDTVDVQRAARGESTNEFDPIVEEWARVNTDPVPALVQAAGGYVDTHAQPGPEDVRVEPFIVKVPAGTDVRNGDRLKVTSCVLLPHLTGEVLRVLAVQDSSLAVVARIRAVRSQPAGVRP